MLINCVAYERGRKLADISVEEISDYLERPECFVWVALKDPGPGELARPRWQFIAVLARRRCKKQTFLSKV